MRCPAVRVVSHVAGQITPGSCPRETKDRTKGQVVIEEPQMAVGTGHPGRQGSRTPRPPGRCRIRVDAWLRSSGDVHQLGKCHMEAVNRGAAAPTSCLWDSSCPLPLSQGPDLSTAEPIHCFGETRGPGTALSTDQSRLASHSVGLFPKLERRPLRPRGPREKTEATTRFQILFTPL